MSLIKHLLTEGKKDIMVNKIGLPDQLAQMIVSNFPKKYVMWVANNIMGTALSIQFNKPITSKGDYQSVKAKYDRGDRKDAIDRILQGSILGRFMNKEYTYTVYQTIIRGIVQNNDMPNLNLKELWTFEDLANVMDGYTVLIDYLDSARPTPTVSSLSWDDAVQRAEEWHEQLEATGRQLDIQEGQVIIKQYEDGYYWLDLRDNNCQLEGGSMGHCGNTSADTLLSLRDEKGEPHVTVAYDYNNVYRQMKGKGNKKPVEKYHKYIADLFIEENEVDGEYPHSYYIDYYDPEYEKKDDFHIWDLSDEKVKEIMNKNEHIITASLSDIKLGQLITRFTKWDKIDIDISDEHIEILNKYNLNDPNMNWIDILADLAKSGKVYEFIEEYNVDSSIDENIFNKEIVYMRAYVNNVPVRMWGVGNWNKTTLNPYINSNKKLYIIHFEGKSKQLDLIYGE